MLAILLFALKIKFVLKIESNASGIKRIREVGRNTRRTEVEYFSLQFFRALAAS